MPYTLKTQQIAVKDPDTGVYSGVDILAEQTTEGLLTEITATGEAVKADVSAQMATERSDFNTYVSGKEAELDQYKSTTETNINTYVTNKNQEIATMIADADEDVSNLEDRKQDVATAVSGMLSKGVDNTLTTANVPAESKATGDLFETIVEGKATQPNDKWNRLWIKPSASDYEIPTMDEFDDVKSAINGADIKKTFIGNPGWNYFSFNFVVGDTYAVIATRGNYWTSANMRSSTEAITLSSSIDNLILFTPSIDAPWLKCFISGQEATTINVYQFGTETVERLNGLIENVSMTMDFSSSVYSGYQVDPAQFEKGAFDRGNNTTYRAAVRVRSINKNRNLYDLKIKKLSNIARFIVAFYDENGAFISDTGWKTEYIIPNNTIYRIMIDGKYGGSDTNAMTVEEVLNTVSFSVINITEVDSRLTDVENQIINAGVTVPAYYIDYLSERETYIQNRAGAGDISFGFITDVHTGDSACNSMLLAKHISMKTSALPFIINGGDVPETAPGKAGGVIEQAMIWQSMMGQYDKHKVYSCRGNHDYLGNEGSDNPYYNASNGMCSSLVMGYRPDNVYTSYDGAMSYYFDCQDVKTRFIVVDEYDLSGSPTFMGQIGLSTEQYNWLTDEALNIDDYRIIIVAHRPLNWTYDTETSFDRIKLLSDIVSAFANHTRITGNWGRTSIDKDFSNNKSELLCVLSGHEHKDYIGYENGFITIGTTCDAIYRTDGYNRQIGTITEGAFDCISINNTSKIAYCTRVGAGHDRIIHLTIIDDLSVGLTTQLTGTISWETDNAEVATVEAGIITSISSGVCQITAMDGIGTQEIWVVSIQ